MSGNFRKRLRAISYQRSDPTRFLGRSPHAPRTLPNHLKSRDPLLACAWPFISEVLPPIDINLPQASRLCEMLAEEPQLEWPLIRLLALKLQPGDMRAAANASGQILSRQRLTLDAASNRAELVKVVKVDPLAVRNADYRAWSTYSGYSDKTREEGRSLRTENDWIGVQKAELDPQTQTLDADIRAYNATADQIKHDSNQLEADRARMGNNAGAIATFNQRVKALNNRRIALREQGNALKVREDALKPRATELKRRIDLYNKRVGEQSERIMVEGSAGRLRVDATLRQALDADLAKRLAHYEEGVPARVSDPAAQAREIAAARYLLGRGGPGPELFGLAESNGHRRLRVEALQRAIPWQKTNEARARQIVTWYGLALSAGLLNEVQKPMEGHILDFVRLRGIETLRTAIRQSTLPDHQKKHLQNRSVEIEKDFFAKKK